VSSEKQMGRSVAIFFIYVAVFLLLFAAAVRGGEPKQKTTAAAAKITYRFGVGPTEAAVFQTAALSGLTVFDTVGIKL